jgi:hypothetical protein
LPPHAIARRYPCLMPDESSSEDTPPGGLVLSPPVDNRSTQAVRDSPPSSDWNEHWTAPIRRRPASTPDSEAWDVFRDEEIAALYAAPEPEERKVGDQPRPECRPFSLKSLLEKFFRNPGFNAVIKCFALAHFLKRNFPRQKVPSRRNSLKTLGISIRAFCIWKLYKKLGAHLVCVPGTTPLRCVGP